MDPSGAPPLPLPEGIESHYLQSSANDITYHYLSSGKKGNPLVLFCHGFPEFSYSWRHILPQLSAKGYYAVAADSRGSGRTTTSLPFDFTEAGDELRQFQINNSTRDSVILIQALGYNKVHCLVGHDAGAVHAAFLALARPDLIQRAVIMSHPYKGPPKVPFDIASDTPAPEQPKAADVHDELAALPEPRKHYKWYYATKDAAPEMLEPKSSLFDFLNGYFYLKSASWPGNKPHALAEWNANELAKMPFYYLMPFDAGMRESVKRQLSLSNDKPSCEPWLSKEELQVYANEWARKGFQGALNWYRVQTNGAWLKDLEMLSAKKIQCPMVTMLGEKDWGSFQEPGVLEAIGDRCERYKGERWIKGAGHWMQQEQPEQVGKVILEMCEGEGLA